MKDVMHPITSTLNSIALGCALLELGPLQDEREMNSLMKYVKSSELREMCIAIVGWLSCVNSGDPFNYTRAPNWMAAENVDNLIGIWPEKNKN